MHVFLYSFCSYSKKSQKRAPLDIIATFKILGIDVTVVDSRNKTVLDLLASHPSTKAIEIRDLIYGMFIWLKNVFHCTTGITESVREKFIYRYLCHFFVKVVLPLKPVV